MPVMVALAALAVGASTSSAATLFSSPNHTGVAPVGTTGLAVSGAVGFTSASSLINSCPSSSLNLRVTRNNGGTVALAAYVATFGLCSTLTTSGTTTPPWTLIATGSTTTSGGFRRFAAAVTDVKFDFDIPFTNFGTYTGNLTTGVTATQPTAAGSLCFQLNGAGTFSGTLTGAGRIDTSWCVINGWSLT